MITKKLFLASIVLWSITQSLMSTTPEELLKQAQESVDKAYQKERQRFYNWKANPYEQSITSKTGCAYGTTFGVFLTLVKSVTRGKYPFAYTIGGSSLGLLSATLLNTYYSFKSSLQKNSFIESQPEHYKNAYYEEEAKELRSKHAQAARHYSFTKAELYKTYKPYQLSK